jgi:diguanylate cyclase (GGDEF)-like protein/PAS domain S-box-containing protein
VIGKYNFIFNILGNNDLPLAVRIKHAAFATTMLIIFTLGSLMLVLTLFEIPDLELNANQSSINIIGEVLATDIKSKLDFIEQLSKSSLVWTALTDSTGRDAYLRPFIEDQKKTGKITLHLLDYRGRLILGKTCGSVEPDQFEQLIGKTLAEKHSKSIVVANGGRPLMIAAFPVVFPYTQDAIGVLVGEIDIFDPFHIKADSLGPDVGLDVLYQGRTIVKHSDTSSKMFFPATYDVSLGETTEQGALAFRLYSIKNPWLGPIVKRILLSTILAVILGMFVWRVSGVVARRLSLRLNSLADACVAIAEEREVTIPEDTAGDEIGILSRTLRSAMESCKKINLNLESLVEEKTEKLLESEVRFRTFFEQNSSVMLLIEPLSGEVIDANEAAAKYYGNSREQMRGMYLKHIETDVAARAVDQVLLGLNLFTSKHRLVSGVLRDVEVHATPISSGGRDLLFAIVHDITDRKVMEEQIQQLAFYDALTQLPNRRLLNDRLTQTMAASKRSNCYCALMFLDLDNFKPLNDAHGHVVGDMLLIEAANRLKSCVREMDTVSRFGGDEFVVMLGELDVDKSESTLQAKIVAEKVLQALSAPYRMKVNVEGLGESIVEHHCTASIGVAIFIDHEASADDTMNWADSAMYQAKEAGRNQIRFYESAV